MLGNDGPVVRHCSHFHMSFVVCRGLLESLRGTVAAMAPGYSQNLVLELSMVQWLKARLSTWITAPSNNHAKIPAPSRGSILKVPQNDCVVCTEEYQVLEDSDAGNS